MRISNCFKGDGSIVTFSPPLEEKNFIALNLEKKIWQRIEWIKKTNGAEPLVLTVT